MGTTITQEERGWPAHFICANRCAFHRTTILTRDDDVQIVVSTVGAMQKDFGRGGQGGYETIGCDRYYETMVFHAHEEECGCTLGDVHREVSFAADWSISDPEACHKADAMHNDVVAEIRRRLEEGESL